MFRKLLIAGLCRLYQPIDWAPEIGKMLMQALLTGGAAVGALGWIFYSGHFAPFVESLLIQVFDGTFLLAVLPLAVFIVFGDDMRIGASPRMRWWCNALCVVSLAGCAYLLALVSAIFALALSLS